MSLCRLLRDPAGSRSFPALFRKSFPGCLHPYPGGPPGALTRFFPGDIGLHHAGTDSALYNISVQRRPYGRFLGAAVIPLCSGLQVCSPPRSLLPHQGSSCFIRPNRPNKSTLSSQGSRGLYVPAYLGSLPPRAGDMLAARIGQLTAWGLSPH